MAGRSTQPPYWLRTEARRIQTVGSPTSGSLARAGLDHHDPDWLSPLGIVEHLTWAEAGYHDECAQSRRITNAARSLDDLSARAGEIRGRVSLRWILVDMREETARHAGHLDLMRETLDGRTGD